MSQTQTEPRPEHAVMHAEPQKQHKWLEKLVGDWTHVTEAMAEPGQPVMKAAGTERVRSLGGLWILAEGEGEMPGGGQAKTLMTLGYDPDKKRFVGTWIGTMMTYLWVYDGELDAAERVLTLNSIGPSMKGDGKTARYQDVIELKSDTHRTLTGRVQGEDGKWHQMMTVEYRRK